MRSSQIRILFVSMLAVFAISAIASASASAAHGWWVCNKVATAGSGRYTTHECTAEGGGKEWEWKEVAGTEKFKLEGASTASKLEGEVLGNKIIIECPRDTVEEGEIEKEGKSKGKITFFECKSYKVTKGVGKPERVKELLTCVVPNISFKFTDKLVTGQGAGPATWGPEDEFNSTGAGEEFVTIDLESCALESTNKVLQAEVEIKPAAQKFKGQVCALPEAAVGKVTHEVSCSSSGSHLTFGGKPSYFFSTEQVKLENGWAWAAE